jgi:glycosyltransferase involved in cell wall biosynthesis
MKKSLAFLVINDLTYDQRMIRICSTLAEAGYVVTLVGRSLAESVPLVPQPFMQKRLRCMFRKGVLFYIEYNIRLLHFLLFHPFDGYCACDLDTALPVHIAGTLRKKARILDAHEYFTEVPEVMDRPFVKAVWKWVGRATVPHFHLRYTVNRSLADVLAKVYGVPFGVIRNLPSPRIPDETPAAAAKGSGKNIILYQGALNAGRGLEQMIQAMPSIQDAELWLVGEGDLSRALREQARETGMQERIIFLGKKSPDELLSITRKATIGLNLLIPGSLNYYYSLANKFFDYMHCGVPSVNMCFPAYREILDEYPVGICIEALEPGPLASVLNGLLKDEGKLSRMKEAAGKARSHFQWPAEARRLVALYDGLPMP